MPDLTTRHSACRSLGIIAAASSISARTGVTPGVPMISTLEISAPSQWERSMTSGPATPGKKYLLPPEKPTTSCGKTGPTTITTSCSTTWRLMRTSTGSASRPSDSSFTRPAEMVPSETKVSGSHHSWLHHGEVRGTPRRRCASSCSSVIAAWVPSATSAVIEPTRPARAAWICAHQLRERAAAGRVGDDQADAPAVEVETVERRAGRTRRPARRRARVRPADQGHALTLFRWSSSERQRDGCCATSSTNG